jgi:Ca2+-binding RTX toxin-like protein
MTVDQNSIVGLYVIYFNRSPDPAGLQFWSTQDVTIEELATRFGESAEAKSIYPFLAAPSLANPEEFINEIYQNAFGRDADAEGLAFWLGVLEADSSPESVAEFVLAVAQGAQGSDAVALQNRADVALQFTRETSNAGIPFDQSLASTSSNIIDTVTSDPATVTAANLATDQVIADIISSGSNFTIIGPDAVLTATGSKNVGPADKFLTTANNKIDGNTNLGGSVLGGTLGAVIQDPSSSDNDILTATIVTGVLPALGLPVTPLISKIETISLTGSNGAIIDIANVSDVKTLEILTGNLQVETSERQTLNLSDNYASTLTIQQGNVNSQTTINLNGTDQGTRITDLNNASKVNLVVKADSILQANDPTKTTLSDLGGKSDFLITGDKDLTINGIIDVVDPTTGQLDAKNFEGKLSVNVGEGSTLRLIVGGKGDDTFSLVAVDDQINAAGAFTINGNGGNDTLNVKFGNDIFALDKVTNIETIVFKESSADTVSQPNDSLVAPGATVTVDASSFSNRTFTFNGNLETNGFYKIIGGSQNDNLIGGSRADTLTGNGGSDNLTGGAGAVIDTFVYTSANDSSAGSLIAPVTFDTITDFQASGDLLDLTALGFTGSSFEGGFGDLGAALPAAAAAAAGLIGKNSLGSFVSGGNTFVLGTDNNDTLNAGDLLIQLNGNVLLTSINFVG